MGFSVSGAAAIIFVTLFVTVGMVHTAASNSFEAVRDAQDDEFDSALETKNTQIEITNATYNATEDELTIEATNTGSSQLSLSNTDLLIDSRYESGWAANATVAGDGETALWLTGENLTISVSTTTRPDRVTLVAGSGVTDTAEVTDA